MNKYFMNNIVKFLKGVTFIPPLLIFSFDVFLVTFLFFMSYLVLENLLFTSMVLNEFTSWSLIGLATVTILMYLFKSYRSFLRYTEFYEIIKVGLVFILSFSMFLIADRVIYFFDLSITIPLFFLFFVYIISFVFLSTYRLIVKEFYFYLNRESKTLKNIIIYGTDYSAILLFQLFKRDLNFKHQIVAFFDENIPDSSKEIYGVKIYSSLLLLEDFLKASNVSEFIISSDSLNAEKKQFIFQVCFKHGVEVKYNPSISDFSKSFRNGDSGFNLEKLRKLKLEDLLGRPQIQIDQNHLSFSLKNKAILVSGAGGSIGSELCRQICKYSIKEIILLDFAESALFDIQQELLRIYPSKNISAVLCDIRFEKDLESVFLKYKPELVFHAAAYKHVPLMESHPKLAVQTNIIGTKNFVDLSIKYEVSKFLLVSTDKAVNPTNVMGATKRCAELYIQSKVSEVKNLQSTDFVITRFGNVLGSNGSVIPLFTKQIENGGPLTVTHQDIVRYFMTIPEACSLVLEAFSMGKNGNVFVFDMGEPVKILDLAEKMIKLSGKKPYLDIPISFTGLRPGEKLYEELFADSEVQSKTYNPKIFIINSNNGELPGIDREIERLINVLDNDFDLSVLIDIIKEIVPEYNNQKVELI